MTCLQTCGSLQPQCHPESAAARLRRASGATAGPSSARPQHCCGRQNVPAAGALSSTGSGRAAQHVSTVAAVTSSDCSTAAPAEQPAWERLEALYTSDHYPLVAPALLRPGLPLHVEPRALQQLLRPVGGLLHLAVQLEEKPPSQLQREDEERRKRQDYYANVGDAIRTLREETPLLFWRDLTYDIYREDVVFKDPRNTVRGKKNYQRIFKGVRIFGRLFFTRCRVDVRRIWQPESNRISMRWQFHGVPRIPWEVEGIFEGVSQFKLDSEGKIYEHSVDNVVLRDPPLGISPLWTSLSRIFNPQPQPCPGINFDDAVEGPLASPAPQATRCGQWVLLTLALPHLALPQPLPSRQRQDLLLE